MRRLLSSSQDNGLSMVFIWPYKNMQRLLSCLRDNGLSMVLHSTDIKHAAAVVVISWQWSEHGFMWLYKETYSGFCPHLMPMV